MSSDPLASATLAANPQLTIHPGRYSAADGPLNLNRFVHQLRFFLKWRKIKGQFLEVRGHEPSTGVVPNPVAAEFYDHSVNPTPPAAISTETPYEMAAPVAGPTPTTPTQQYSLRELVSRYDSRDFAKRLLSYQFNQVKFQKRAMKHAICATLEEALIVGDQTEAPTDSQFDGLNRLIDRKMGQDILGPNSGLNVFNEAMSLIRSRKRKVSLIVMNQKAWRKVLELQRASGFRPEFRYNKRLRQRILYMDGVPVCLSDHIVTSALTGAANIFILWLGSRNGVYGIRAKKKPNIFFTRTAREDSPFQSYEAHLFCGLVSTTSDALVRISDWDTTLSGP